MFFQEETTHCKSAVQEDGSSWLTPFPRCVCRRRALQGRINEAIEVHDVTNKEEAKAARRATLEEGAPLVPDHRTKSISGNQGEGGSLEGCELPGLTSAAGRLATSCCLLSTLCAEPC